MTILVIDAQGGGIGRQLVAAIKQNIPAASVIADSLLGEVTPRMALAVAQSNTKRILIPFNHCDNIIAGISDFSIGALIQNAVDEIKKSQAATKKSQVIGQPS